MKKNKITKIEFKPTPWAFISSVRNEFEKYRQAAINACIKARVLPISMESWSAESKPSLTVCYEHIEECDIVILILGYKYGAIHHETGKSYTELEWLKTIELEKPLLAFFASKINNIAVDSLNPEDIKQMNIFKNKLKEYHCGVFNSPEQLNNLVYQSLIEWKKDYQDDSKSKFKHGDWITAAIVTPEKAESIMKRLQGKFAILKDQHRDKAYKFIYNGLTAEIEKYTQKTKNIGDTDEHRLDACISHALVDILERQLGNFIFEFEERKKESAYEIFRDVVKNMIKTEKNKWK